MAAVTGNTSVTVTGTDGGSFANAAIGSSSITVIGTVNAEFHYAVIGDSSITIVDNPTALLLGGYGSTNITAYSEAFSGAEGTIGNFHTEFSGTGITDEDAVGTIGNFDTEFVGTGAEYGTIGNFKTTFSGTATGTDVVTTTTGTGLIGNFQSALSGTGGEYGLIGNFASSFSGVGSDIGVITGTIGNFGSVLSGTANGYNAIVGTIGNFGNGTFYADGTIGNFASTFSGTATFTPVTPQTYALVMNINTNAVTRYTNYGFIKIVTINWHYYGVKADGLYLLEGTTDSGTAIDGNITTKEFDFGTNQSKNVSYIYLDSDTTETITPYIDTVTGTAQSSQYSGRRVRLGRGTRGRYWKFKISTIQKLQGVEFMPDLLQRKVK